MMLPNLQLINREVWNYRTDAALNWIRRSIAVTGGGSAHSRHLLLGWARAYPETTGYLIETLLNYAAIRQDESLRRLAENALRWLLGLQLPSGAFPGLLVGNTRPSVFNTAQILFGLMAEVKDTELRQAAEAALKKALAWLLETLSPDGSWKSYAFVPGFVPSYYTRAVWPVLLAGRRLQQPETAGLMQKALHFYAERFLPNHAVKHWGFRLNEPAFTHTIAYTLEGFWECGHLLNEKTIQQSALQSVERLLQAKAGNRTPGRFDEQWRGDLRFSCLTGNCQLSILSRKMGKATNNPLFINASDHFLEEVLPFQKSHKNPDINGALPGSVPIWGAYLPLRYPNWGVKFFLDAMGGVYEDRFKI